MATLCRVVEFCLRIPDRVRAEADRSINQIDWLNSVSSWRLNAKEYVFSMWPTFFRQRERDNNRRNGKCHFRQSSLIDLCGRHRNFGQRTRRRAYRTIRRSHNCPIEHRSSRLRPIYHKKIFSSRRNLYRRSWEKSAQFRFFSFPFHKKNSFLSWNSTLSRFSPKISS